MKKPSKLAALSILIIFFSVGAKEGIPDNFPLMGSEWLIAQGFNDRIYPSVLPLNPKKVVLITFADDTAGEFRIKWANLEKRDYAGTYDVVQDIQAQFKKNSNVIYFPNKDINTDDGAIHIFHKTYDDTVWSMADKCLGIFDSSDPDFANYTIHSITIYTSESETKYESYDKLKANDTWTKEKPYAIIERSPTQAEIEEFTVGIYDDKNKEYIYLSNKLNGEDADQPFYIKEKDMFYEFVREPKFKTDNLKYWQLHIHPVIIHYAINPEDGKPLFFPEYRMDKISTVKEKREQSIKNPTNLDYKPYRQPFYSDTASVVLSVSFIEDNSSNPLDDRERICVTSNRLNTKVEFTHNPDYIYQVRHNYYTLKEAILKSYAETEEELDFAKNLDGCSIWEWKDEVNCEKIFPLKNRSNGIYKRDWAISDAYYMYDRCPCINLKKLNGHTVAELSKYLLHQPKTCSYKKMLKTRKFYYDCHSLLTKRKDRILLNKRIAEINLLIKKKQKIYKFYGDKYDMRIEENCPRTWIDEPIFNNISYK